MTCALNCAHEWNGPPLTEWIECEACEGTGLDPNPTPGLDDIVVALCFECGGEEGEAIEVADTCSKCGASMIDVAMMEGP